MQIRNYIWYEKYRPQALEEMSLPPEQRKKFNNYIDEKELPHLLFYGPPGSGKTTLANILINAIECRRLVLNASSEDRGIATIKGKVKQFAKAKPIGKDRQLNVVFLDEADQLTQDAQKALRNTMETYSKTCRFILTANYVGKIIKALQSRCQSFEFSTYPVEDVRKLLFTIAKSEKVSVTKKDVRIIVDRFYPDIRSTINNLQICSVDGELNIELSNQLRIDFRQFIDLFWEGKIRKLRELWVGVVDFVPFYRVLFDQFVEEIEDSSGKAEVSILVADYLWKDSAVADREINFTACCLEIMETLELKQLF